MATPTATKCTNVRGLERISPGITNLHGSAEVFLRDLPLEFRQRAFDGRYVQCRAGKGHDSQRVCGLLSRQRCGSAASDVRFSGRDRTLVTKQALGKLTEDSPMRKMQMESRGAGFPRPLLTEVCDPPEPACLRPLSTNAHASCAVRHRFAAAFRDTKKGARQPYGGPRVRSVRKSFGRHPIWKCSVQGILAAEETVSLLALLTNREVFAAFADTKEIVVRANAPRANDPLNRSRACESLHP